jgi:hypothetical protein
MVFELVDDIEEALADQWAFRNKRTYTDYAARNEFFISGTGYSQSRVSSRAPIFYDSDDTARFFNGAGGINFLTGSSNRVTIYSDDSGFYVSNAEGVGGLVRLGAAYNLPGLYINPSLYLQSENTIFFRTQNVQRMSIDSSGILTVSGDVRAPIFYDSNNTGYYVDPASTSNLNIINVQPNSSSTGGGINFNGAGSAFIRGTSGDGASSTTSNLQLQSWFGIGFGPSITGQSVPVGENAVWIDCRSGDLTARANITAYSDIRVKKDIETIDGALELVSRMRGVRYTRIDSGRQGIGVIAQEVFKVIPEVVHQSMGDDDMLSVAYGNIVGLLIEAIKEQQAHINRLELKINSIEDK